MQIAVETFLLLSETYADLDTPSEMISPAQIASLLADWTDPRNAMYVQRFNFGAFTPFHFVLSLVILGTFQAKLTMRLFISIWQSIFLRFY